jgi:SAM-dependent methyltransferase
LQRAKEANLDSAADLQTSYANRFSGLESRRHLVWQVLAGFFQKWIEADSAVLDLGAGYCEFINNIKAKEKYALDLNPTTVESALKEVSVISQDVCEPWRLPDRSIDVVFSSNFLEHLPSKDALKHCLKEANRVLTPGGKIILLGPNIRFCSDVYWDFIDHHIALSDRSIVEVLQLTQFDVIKVIDRFLPFTMQGARILPTHPRLVTLYLHMPWVWSLLGKQFLVIATKAEPPKP